MPLNQALKKVLVIGSGPIVIGQAAEFDYSGTQACGAIREEGIETVLVNSNPATIMTDSETADKVYIESLDKESLTKIIAIEKPCGILAGFGGQTALNLAMALEADGTLEAMGTKLLGMRRETIYKAEDRDAFRSLMKEIGEPIPESIIATDYKTCESFMREVGLPLIIRPAYTLGGTGGGIAEDEKTFEALCSSGLANSPIGQILIERSIAGWKEIEYEVMRDRFGNAMIVCNMENIDPVGVHTGDSIVVAPSQTLPDYAYQMLRDSSLKIIDALKIEGGCNVQFGLHPNHKEYIVIEVNPRVSRSSALASKAAGYPIAKIAAKIALGYGLHELKNYATQNTSACFEPTLDYVVVKFPKWPFDKFKTANKTLSTQMKATGEVMAIDRTFSGAMIKAVTSLDGGINGLRLPYLETLGLEAIEQGIKTCDDKRLFMIYEGLRRGVEVDQIHQWTKIDPWFLNQLKDMVTIETDLKNNVDGAVLTALKAGFVKAEIEALAQVNADDVTGVKRVYKIVDTCSAEFEAHTPYFYSCFEEEDEALYESEKEKVVVIGSGPIRIGQGIEFDYSCVHAVKALRNKGYEAIMVNNNPETVSTDFDVADKLYFESLHFDYVKTLLENEKPKGVVVQFGGQTAINLAETIEEHGYQILGTPFDAIDLTEDRDRFRLFLEEQDIAAPKGDVANTLEEAIKVANTLGYPLVIRPSYVIGGSSMTILYDEADLYSYFEKYGEALSGNLLLIDQYLRGTEIEVDAISDGENILIPGIMEHIEKTGVHSGDSICVYPPRSLGAVQKEHILRTTEKIAKGIGAKGLINVQYVWYEEALYVIEVNPRASRTVPILSKITGTPMVDIAMEIMLGKTLADLPYGTGLKANLPHHAVKVPVFSTEKMGDADMFLSPEMKSTGEVLGLDYQYEKAVYKAFKAAGYALNLEGGFLISLKDEDKTYEAVQVARGFEKRGYKLYATEETAAFLEHYQVICEKVTEERAIQYVITGEITATLNTPTKGLDKSRFGYTLRNKMIGLKKPLFTSIETSLLYLEALELVALKSEITPYTIQKLINREF